MPEPTGPAETEQSIRQEIEAAEAFAAEAEMRITQYAAQLKASRAYRRAMLTYAAQLRCELDALEARHA